MLRLLLDFAQEKYQHEYLLNPQKGVIGIGILGGMAVGGCVVYGIGVLVYSSILWLYEPLGFITAILAVSIGLFYVGFLVWFAINKLADNYPEYSDVPIETRIGFHVSLGVVLIRLFDYYLAVPVMKFLMQSLLVIENFVVQSPLLTLWLILTAVALFLVIKLSSPYFTDEKKFVKLQKSIVFVTRCWVLASLLIYGISFMSIGKEVMYTTIDLLQGPMMWVLVPPLVCVGIAGYFMFETVNDNTIQMRLISKEYAKLLSTSILSSEYMKEVASLLKKNKWFLGLGKSESEKVVDRIKSMSTLLFHRREYGKKVSLLRHIIPSLNETLLSKLEALSQKIIQSFSDDKQKLNCIIFVIKGGTIEEYQKMLDDKAEKARLSAEKWDKFWKPFKSFGSWIASPFVYMGRKIKEFILTIKDLWELFNERCPFVSESKMID